MTDPVADQAARLRAAAARLRETAPAAPRSVLPSARAAIWSPPVVDAVADWLDGEAALISELEPMVTLINAAIENTSGVIGILSLGRRADGSIDMRAESTPAALRLADLILESHPEAAAGCGACWTCVPDFPFMRVCATCGNKRCPHANDHRNQCTGSNEPGQPGSAYPATPRATP